MASAAHGASSEPLTPTAYIAEHLQNLNNIGGAQPSGEGIGRPLRIAADVGAVARALGAGLQLQDIDGIFAATSSHAFPTLSVAEYLLDLARKGG